MDAREEKIQELRERKASLRQGGGPDSIEKQHAKGKLTARERLDLLVDPGSFVEMNLFAKHHCTDFGMDELEAPGDGVITGYGEIDGRSVSLVVQDFTMHGGSVGEVHIRKIIRMMDLALEKRIPIILLNDSGGARAQEQHAAMEGYIELMRRHARASGIIPQITLVMGPVGGGPCYGPALTDVIFMVKGTSSMFIGGPPVVKAVTGEVVTQEQLGGAEMHATVSGVCDLATENDEQCIQKLKELLSFLPSNNMERTPVVDTGDDRDRMNEDLTGLVPFDFKRPYDMYQIITRVVDNGDFFELKPDYATNVITGFCRMGGRSVGLLASQPLVMAGSLDINAADKASKFVRYCDAFNIPLVNLVDTPAYVVGKQSEQSGIIRHGAKLLYAYAEATVPIVSVVFRKGYAGAYAAMGSHFIGGDLVFAWPWAEFSIFGVDAGISILMTSRKLRDKVANADDPEKYKEEMREEYRKKYLDIYEEAPFRHVDDIIEPKETRPTIIKALNVLSDKKPERAWRKHGIMPV